MSRSLRWDADRGKRGGYVEWLVCDWPFMPRCDTCVQMDEAVNMTLLDWLQIGDPVFRSAHYCPKHRRQVMVETHFLDVPEDAVLIEDAPTVAIHPVAGRAFY